MVLRLTLARPGGACVLAGLTVVAGLVLVGCGDGAEGPAEPPGVTAARDDASPPADPIVTNVLLISLDTLRADRLEAYGYGRPTSPNLEALGGRAVVFDQARAQSSQTAPSHASLFTSDYVGAHRVINVHGENPKVHRLPPAVTTLAEALSDAGLETAAFVNGGNLSRRMGFDRGFDVWDEQLEDVRGRVDACLKWMLAPERGPFFAVIHTYQVHAPYLPPRELVPRFVDGEYDGPLRERLERYLDLPTSEAWAAAVGPDYWEGMLEYTDGDVRFLSDLYDAEIAYLDAEMRRLLEYLYGSNLAGDTAVVVLSDHGEEFMDHGKYQHDQVFEELLRVPLMIRMPPSLEQRGWVGRRSAPVGLVDVAPTVAELLGVDGSGFGWRGRSLVPLLESPSAPGAEWVSRPSYAELVIDPGPKYYRCVTWQGWKYIHAWQSDIDHTWEWLFHLETDPGERRNRIKSEDPEVLKILQALKDLLEQHALENAARAAELGDGGAVEMDEDLHQLMRQLGYVK